jgi:Fur family ferric uptake transcriptional regulator
MKTSSPKRPSQERGGPATALLRTTGERVTEPRVAVLEALLAFDHAASHLDVTDALNGQAIDRVTVYRVLDWLVSVGLAHRIAGDDRVWRYMASNTKKSQKPGAQHSGHAHFTCDTCGQTFCLESVKPKIDLNVPHGFRTSEIDVKVRGRCAHCA